MADGVIVGLGLTPEVIRLSLATIVGTPDDCVAQVRRAMAAGAHQFVITSFVPDPRTFMRRWSREIAAAVG